MLFNWGGSAPDFGTYTLHHLYYGFALLAVAGWLAINYRDKNIYHITAVIYGMGLGVFFDEIGLLLTEFGNYYDSITYTVVLAFSLLLLNIVFFRDFWISVRTNIRSYAKEKKFIYGPLNLMGLINIVDEAEERMSQTKKITSVFTGLVLIGAGILVIEYPELIKYWVAGAFFLSGIAYIVREFN